MCRVVNLTNRVNTVPFCLDLKGRETMLTCFENTNRYAVVLEVEGTVLKYGIEPDGCLFAVMCDDRFVISLDRIFCRYYAFCRDGNDVYEYKNDDRILYTKSGDDKRFAYMCSADAKSEDGSGVLYSDGSILLDGYKISRSDQNHPFVFARRGFNYIDNNGSAFVPENRKQDMDLNRRYIILSTDRGVGILSDRTILLGKDRRMVMPDNLLAVDVHACNWGFLVHCHDGSVFQGTGGEWTKVAAGAYAIDAHDDVAAIGTEQGIVVYYKRFDSPITIKIRKGYRVTDLGISQRWLVFNTTKHGAFSILFDEKSGKKKKYFHRTKDYERMA